VNIVNLLKYIELYIFSVGINMNEKKGKEQCSNLSVLLNSIADVGTQVQESGSPVTECIGKKVDERIENPCSFDEKIGQMFLNFFDMSVSPPENINVEPEPPCLKVNGRTNTARTGGASVPTILHDDINSDKVRRCVSNKELFRNDHGRKSSSYPHKRSMIARVMNDKFVTFRNSFSLEQEDIPLTKNILSNQDRTRRRALHNQAVLEDLCEIVTDLFLAESSLLNPNNCSQHSRPVAYTGIKNFLESLPLRYGLTVNTPGEVLVHLRLMASVKKVPNKAAVHIMKLPPDDGNCWQVTVSCADCHGLLEYIVKILSTGGSRVLDADIMISNDNIVLDRFQVQMNGRLLLDKLEQYIETYLNESKETSHTLSSPPKNSTSIPVSTQPDHHGSLYFNANPSNLDVTKNIDELIEHGIPLTDYLRSIAVITNDNDAQSSGESAYPISSNKETPLINRNAVFFDDMKVIPFRDLILLDLLGKGRVSSIYHAARLVSNSSKEDSDDIHSEEVALKLATCNECDLLELQHEAEIACLLNHVNICQFLGVAFSPDECFCIAYEFCEGGSLLSLLNDRSRCYEYIPIALDIANGMAYLHSKNVIHRDLKPSNVLLTGKYNRAKIADFGVSITNHGQELTGETGTYRWMAPEVIRHESYSSNADVYSFGILLWQLITREVPFANLSPVQTAYAVAEGERPSPLHPTKTPDIIRRLVYDSWDEDSQARPSFTYITLTLADYARIAFRPDNVGVATVEIANEVLANVNGSSNINVDFSAVTLPTRLTSSRSLTNSSNDDNHHDIHSIGLEL